MKRIFILLALLLVGMFSYGDEKSDTSSLKEGVYVIKSGCKYSHYGTTFTEIYDVVTDSIVYRFGLEFKSSDSTFIRKVEMEGCNRKLYDQMNETTARIIAEQDKYRKETIEFLDEFKASYEVWRLFKLYNVLRK